MIQKVEFISQATAVGRIPENGTGVISITTPGIGPAPLHPGWVHLLRLEFDDFETPAPGAVLFGVSEAVSILRWLERVENRIHTVTVHCHAGISRSAAVALFIAERYALVDFDYSYRAHNKHVHEVLTSCLRMWTIARRIR